MPFNDLEESRIKLIEKLINECNVGLALLAAKDNMGLSMDRMEERLSSLTARVEALQRMTILLGQLADRR